MLTSRTYVQSIDWARAYAARAVWRLKREDPNLRAGSVSIEYKIDWSRGWYPDLFEAALEGAYAGLEMRGRLFIHEQLTLIGEY